MRSASEACAQRLAAAQSISAAAALIAPGFGRGPAGGTLAVIERFARDAEAGPAIGAGAGRVRDMVRAQHSEAGDGTATALILAADMVRRAMAALAAGADPVRLMTGLEAARDAVLTEVRGRATAVTAKAELAAVVSTALSAPELGELVADAFDRAGKDGVVTIEPSGQPGLGLATGEGMTVEAGYAGPGLAAGPESGEVILREPLVLVTAGEIRDRAELTPVIEHAAAAGRPLVMFAAGVAAGVPAVPAAGGTRGGAMTLAVAVPGFADQRGAVLGDVAAVTGATVSGGGVAGGPSLGGPGSLGGAQQVIVTRDRTLIVAGAGDRAVIADRVRAIRAEIGAREAYGEREQLMTRLARLAGGSATLQVGGATEAAAARLAAEARRGLLVARLAMDHGILPGGGAALAAAERAAGQLPRSVRRGRAGGEAAGARVVLESLAAPMRQLAANAVPMRPQVIDALPVVAAAVANATELTARVLND
jgi:chaperonin GroEL